MFRPSSLLCGAIVAAVALVAPATVSAAPVTYTISCVGNGSFGGVGFTNQSIVFTAVGNTDSVQVDPNYPDYLNTMTMQGTVAVGGFVPAGLPGGLRVAVPMDGSKYLLTGGTDDIYVAQKIDKVVDLKHSFGPFTGDKSATDGGVEFLPSIYLGAARGYLLLNDSIAGNPTSPGVAGNTTWQAVVTPEPASLAAVAVAGVTLLRRRRIAR